MEIAERKRLLYVAMTRARDYLGVFLQRTTANRTSFKSWITDVLDLNLDEDEVESGLRHTSLGGYKASYSVTTAELSPVLMTGAQQEPSERHVEEKPDLRLLYEISETPQEFQSTWSGWSRVTPEPGKEATLLDATTLGVYFHVVMETLSPTLARPTKEMLESLALNLGSATAHPSSLKALLSEGSSLLDIFYRSDLFKLLLGAKNRFSEIPYWVLGGENVLSRRPDLLVQSSFGEWFVIDYKTDHVAEANVANQARLHLNQLSTYVADLVALTGFDLIPSVYFARLGILHDYRSLAPGLVDVPAPVVP